MAINEAIKQRTRNLTAIMKQKSLDAILLTSRENVSYTTNFSGDDSWALIGKRKTWLLTDSRYSEQAKAECAGCEILVRQGAIIELLSKVLARNRSIKSISVEPSMSVAVFDSLKEKLQAELTVASGFINDLRQIKDDLEVSLIITAAKKAKIALANLSKQITVGISERELAGIIELEMSRLLVKPSFETIVAFGANASRPHHSPGSARLRKNDTILIDYGVKYKGYCCDITRCFAVGEVSQEYRHAYEAVLEAQKAAILKVADGAKINQADLAARAAIARAKLADYGHGTGHGIGLNIHELPTIYSANEQEFQSGQVVTIEPGVYIPGKMGIRIEDDVLVTQTGCKILTRGKQSPKLEVLKI